MTSPITPVGKSTKDRVLDDAEDVLKASWSATTTGLRASQWASQKANKATNKAKEASQGLWSRVPDWRGWKTTAEEGAGALANGARSAANWTANHTPDTVKNVLATPGAKTGLAVLGGVAAAGMYAPVATVATGLAIAAGTSAAIGSRLTGTSRTKAVNIGAATAIGAASAVVLLPSLATAGAIATVAALSGGAAGGGTAAIDLMAKNSNQSVLIPLPGRKPIEFRTPGADENEPTDPIKALDDSVTAIKNKLTAFDTAHPIGMACKRQIQGPPIDREKVEALKTEEEKTNENFTKFIDNASTFATVFFIFSNRLNLGLSTDEINKLVMEITQTAARAENGTKPNLWDTCINCLENHGKQLSIGQWVSAKFWYFLTYTIGIVPNSLKKVGEAILDESRRGIDKGNAKPTIIRMLEVTSSFLDRYNGAAEAYANAGQPPAFIPNKGDLANYRREIIDRTGGDLILQEVLADLRPGQDLGEQMMLGLCKKFCVVLVDKFFPEIPFFEGLKKFKILGIRFGVFFDFLDWIFGSLINWSGKKIIKAYAPGAIHSIVKKGLEETMPGKYAFQKAIASALTQQILDLKEKLNKKIPSKPLRPGENRDLKETVAKLLNAVQLNSCKSKEAIRQQLNKIAELEAIQVKLEKIEQKLAKGEKLSEEEETLKSNLTDDEILHKKINEVVLDAAHLLIDHYTKNPEALEKLMGKLLELCNKPLQTGAEITTEKQYDEAVVLLNQTMNDLMSEQIKETVHKKIHGEKPETLRMILEGKRTPDGELAMVDGKPVYPGLILEEKEKGKECFLLLEGLAHGMLERARADLPGYAARPVAAEISEAMARHNTLAAPNDCLLKELDNYVKVIREFYEFVESLNIDSYEEEMEMVTLGFTRVFSPIYQDTAVLTNLAFELQRIQKSYDKDKDFAQLFTDIETKIERDGNARNLAFVLKEKLLMLNELDKRFDSHESNRGNNVTAFETLIFQLDRLTVKLGERRELVRKVVNLGDPIKLSVEILLHPKTFTEKVRKAIPENDPDRAQLLRSIALLQENSRRDPTPDLTFYHRQITEQFTALVEKYKADVNETLDEKAAKVAEIRDGAVARKIVYLRKRDEGLDTLTEKLAELEQKTNDVRLKIEAAELPQMHFPSHALLNDPLFGGRAKPFQQYVLDYFDRDISKPIQVKVEGIAQEGFKFIISPEMAEVGARLALGQFIRRHKSS